MSCYSNKRIIYLQDEQLSHLEPSTITNFKNPYRIQPNDVLSVRVQSSDPEISSIFNLTLPTNSFGADPGNLYLGGYSVSENGDITIPIIGKLRVKDLTLEEIRELGQQEVNKYLNNATIIVKLISFKVTILGEVNRPGYHYVYNDQLTILEAIGLAGDLTRFGKRENVRLIRQTADGTEALLLDLTNPDIISSEYFFLQPNDVVYVEPFRAQTKRINLDLLNLLFSAITTTVLVLNFVDNN